MSSQRANSGGHPGVDRRVGVLDAAERLVAEHHPEAERVVGGVALPDGDLVVGAGLPGELLAERAEVEPARPAADHRDPHPRQHIAFLTEVVKAQYGRRMRRAHPGAAGVRRPGPRRRLRPPRSPIPPVHGAVNRPLARGARRARAAARTVRGPAGRAAARRRGPPALPAARDPGRPSPPRPRPRSPCRVWAATRSCRPGRREQVERWIPGVVAGTRRRGLRAVRARRRLRRGGPVAAGRPPTVTGGGCTARRPGSPTRPRPTSTRSSPAPPRAPGPAGVTAFVVAGDAEGLVRRAARHGRPARDRHGWSSTAVRVGADDVLGEVDRGFAVAMRTLDLFRPSVGAFAVGMAQAALDAALELGDDPRGLRRPADPPAVGRAHARRDGDPHRGRPAAGAAPRRRRTTRARRPRRSRRRRDGQAVRHRERPVGGRPGRAAARRARAAARPPARAALS